MKFFDINSITDEQKFALFYGVMLGDGCLSQYKTKDKRERLALSITGSFADDKEFYENILVPLLKSLGRKGVTIKDRSYAGAIEINFPDENLFNRIKNYGFPVGKKGPNINIPGYFYEKNLLRYIVAGFMATDGSLVLTKNPNKYYPRIEGNGISKKLIAQIQEYLVKLGMNGAFYLSKRKNMNSQYKFQQQYRFQFNGKDNLMLFENKISFVNPKHQIKFNNFLSYNQQYDEIIAGIPSQKQKNIRLESMNGCSRI